MKIIASGAVTAGGKTTLVNAIKDKTNKDSIASL
mgnify:CR=1 FL=1